MSTSQRCLSGQVDSHPEPVNKECTIYYKGGKIAFCCGNCKGKAESAEDKVALLFQDAAFARGFEVKKPE